MDEHDPVDDGEFVFRRIHRTFFDPRVQIPIQFPAFRPNPHDTTGLAVFRARFAQPVDTLASLDPAKAKDYYVARLAVRDLRNLGLTVVPEPVPGGPSGHAVIPEMSWHAYRAQKEQRKLVLVELAKLASADIVHRPS
ncbi:MAG: hypothetical protein L0Z62_36215 [Gemmataceae bacterium]|nr:hypothetical protein [Gemmataceae bacterium]